MKMHTNAECAVKLKAIKMLSEQLERRHQTEGSYDNLALSESISDMCRQLIQEFPDDEKG
jgi:hypothetical protein